VDSVTLVLSRTPAWAVTTAQDGDSSCNYYGGSGSPYNGACYAPNGTGIGNDNHLAPDGTGDDLIWRYWVTAIATEVNSLGTGYAHVKYWEIWNEFDRNATSKGAVSWYANTTQGTCISPCPTPDQLIRMTQDARCIIEGNGYVDNYNGNPSTACDNLGWGPPIDTTARIVAPSLTAGGPPQGPPQALKCFLYCDQTACTNWYGSSWRVARPLQNGPIT